jgi:uncharacterized protein YgiM (DUF1202 family)
MKYIVFTLVLSLILNLRIHAQERPQTYSVSGIAENDTLSVRSRPSDKSSIIAQLRNGTSGIQVVGQTVTNGSDDWIPITVSGIRGWVRPKYLASNDATTRAVTKATKIPEDLPSVDLSIPPDWRPHSREWTRVYGAAANGYIDEARRRLVRGETGTLDDIRYGWADYLYQQQRIKFWTPIVIAAGITLADAMLNLIPALPETRHRGNTNTTKASLSTKSSDARNRRVVTPKHEQTPNGRLISLLSREILHALRCQY